MADEVPVCDVLSEAMEYLSKLGTNLRARSENLKEKKISRGKLKNSHAVQKVANKVLLICELSKKSLDNVETGVRKVLSLVEKSYGASSNNGAKSSESRKESNPVHFIEYKSQKLRMSTKINLKHYMSAKVKTRKMPPAMQSKYPVYYDCKLYRSRKIESVTQEGKDSDDNTLIKIIPDKKSSINNDRTKDVVPETDTLSPKSTNSQKHEEADNQINHKKSTKEQKATHKRRHLSTDSSGEEKKRKKHRKHSHGDGIETINKKSRENSTEKPPKCNEINKRSTTEKCEQEANESKKVDDSVKIIEDNSKSDDEFKKCNKDKILEAQSNNSEKLHIDSDQNEENNEDMDTNKSETSENDKPLIRCININKLLKPDVAKKSSSKSVTDKKKHISKTKPVKTEKTQHSTISKNEEPVLDTKNDEEYWTLKRAEVKAFKPRSFSINVARLPKLSQTFLQKYGLVRIVKKGHIIFEVDNNTASNGGKLSVEKITKVKNALLNDSDSDENSTLPVKSKKVHKAIIDSDSENNESEQNPAKTNDNIEDSMIDNVISKDVDAVDSNTNVTEDTPDTKIQEKTKSTKKNETVNEVEITVESNKNAENETNKSKYQDNSSNKLEKNEFENIDENKKTKNHDVQTKETDTEKIKVALLNESDSEKSDKETVKDQGEKSNNANNKKPSHETLKTSDPKTIKDALLKDSDSDKNEEHDKSYDLDTSSPHNIDMENLAKTVTDIIKKNLLIDSDSDHHDHNTPGTKDNQVDMEKDDPNQQSENLEKIDPGGPCPTQTDSHKDNSEQEPTPIKVQRVKSSLLNESSSESDSKKKRESHSKSESVKKKLGSLSNSDVEKEHSKSSHDDDVRLKHKRRKKKHRYTRSSSSSSEDLRMNPRKKLKLKSGLSKKSIPEDSAGEKGSQEDGRSSDDDNLSNASSLKVRKNKT